MIFAENRYPLFRIVLEFSLFPALLRV